MNTIKNYIPFIIAFALFMENMDGTIINTAIPMIAESLQTNPINLKIALTSYFLSLAIFIPISGWFSDRFGTRNVFVAAIIVFTLGSLFCGLAWNLEVLVLSRIMQGIGGALMMPVGQLILIKTFSKENFLSAMNYVSIPSQVGRALGPVLGGFIVTYMSWRWIFFVNIPIGIAGLYFAYKYLPNYLEPTAEKLDVAGFVLIALGLACAIFALQFIGEGHSNSLLIIGLLMGTFFLFVAYSIWARFTAKPFLDFNIFKTATFRITVLGSFVTRCCTGGLPFILPLYFQLGLSLTPLVSGLLLLPYAIAVLFAKFLIKPCLRQFGFKYVLVSVSIMLGLSTMSFAWITPETSDIWIITLMVINGLLMSVQLGSMNVLSYVDLPEADASKGSSLGRAAQMLSMSFGVAIAAIVLTFVSGENANTFHIAPLFFQQTFLILGLMTLLSALCFLFLKKDDGAEASGHKAYFLKATPIVNKVEL